MCVKISGQVPACLSQCLRRAHREGIIIPLDRTSSSTPVRHVNLKLKKFTIVSLSQGAGVEEGASVEEGAGVEEVSLVYPGSSTPATP